jgi:hypothetical protein
LSALVNLGTTGSVTFKVTVNVPATASGSLVNVATVAPPPGVGDPNPANNTASDSDSITPARPNLAVLDGFNRLPANTLGANWSQLNIGGAAIRIPTGSTSSAGVAFANSAGNAYWNATTFAAKQGAAFTIANATFNNDSLILKATGTLVLGVAPNFIRVQVAGSAVTVAATKNYGVSFTSTTLPGANVANGDSLSALVDATGTVSVWKNAVYLGSVALPTDTLWSTGGGRIGMQLPNAARVDNFAGGTVP